PSISIVLGGPEVSYETDRQSIVQYADCVITGEAEHEFPKVCKKILSGLFPEKKIIHSQNPNLEDLKLPYNYYSSEDLAQKAVYIEASRGCPFHCEFCLSALDESIRYFDKKVILSALDDLLRRGARHFKFVDRTFNLPSETSKAILDFFANSSGEGIFVHFEIVPDILSDEIKAKLQKFPPALIQLEAGVQSLNPEVCELINRRQDCKRTLENLAFLKQRTHSYIHADLVVGLPSEDLISIAEGFDALYSLDLHEIQIGILKRLNGAPIVKHEKDYELVFDTHAPYEILSTSTLSFHTLQQLKRLSHVFDFISNSGNFKKTMQLLVKTRSSSFQSFLDFSNWVYLKLGRVHSVALENWCELLFAYLVEEHDLDKSKVAEVIFYDYSRKLRYGFPKMLKRYIRNDNQDAGEAKPPKKWMPKRQQQHMNYE
ncbi:MAG: DUF4080 domain-containing protein, partial [SAR324 cluster bacterium]|nr:DUF4080 domain-containing protein [SAR324 cluster bacterium]